MGNPREFQLPSYPVKRYFTYPTAITLDEQEIEWTNKKGTGRIAYREILAIELQVGDPDPGERPNACVIWTSGGAALSVFCDIAGREKHHELYADFIRFLHQQLSPEDRNRISFKTDGKLTPKADRLLVAGVVGLPAIALGLFLVVGHPAAVFMGLTVVEIVYVIAIMKLIPKEPRTYCPDPLDEKFIPR
jgi:hypothetical protein